MNQPAEPASTRGDRIKILSILGTRPEVIKMAPVLKELELHPGRIASKLCVTAQHRDLMDQMIKTFNLRPDYDLDLMRPGQSPASVASATLSMLEPILKETAPDWVLVQGDTTSAVAAALAAQYDHFEVGHVEAGLRTQDPWNPFPEEINRKIIGAVAKLHFAPTKGAKENLLREGVADENIHITGNPGIDALFWALNRIGNEADETAETVPDVLNAVDPNKKTILVTAHRRENQGKPLEDICAGLREIAERYRDTVQIIFPVHINPAVLDTVFRSLANQPNIFLFPPVNYLQSVYLLKHACLILTDSGGIQEEAPALGKPVLVLRDKTERPETIQASVGSLVGTDPTRIIKEASKYLDEECLDLEAVQPIHLYGDGAAAKRIVSILLGEDYKPFVPDR